jgi:hypothetical protein
LSVPFSTRWAPSLSHHLTCCLTTEIALPRHDDPLTDCSLRTHLSTQPRTAHTSPLGPHSFTHSCMSPLLTFLADGAHTGSHNAHNCPHRHGMHTGRYGLRSRRTHSCSLRYVCHVSTTPEILTDSASLLLPGRWWRASGDAIYSGCRVRGGWCGHDCLIFIIIIIIIIIIITPITSSPLSSLSTSLWLVVGAVPALSPGMTALMRTSRESDGKKTTNLLPNPHHYSTSNTRSDPPFT